MAAPSILLFHNGSSMSARSPVLVGYQDCPILRWPKQECFHVLLLCHRLECGFLVTTALLSQAVPYSPAGPLQVRCADTQPQSRHWELEAFPADFVLALGFLYLLIYTYIYIHIYMYIHIYAYLHTHINTNTCMYICGSTWGFRGHFMNPICSFIEDLSGSMSGRSSSSKMGDPGQRSTREMGFPF